MASIFTSQVQDAFRNMDVSDHPAIRSWREAQEREAVEEAKDMEEDHSEIDSSGKPNLKMDFDPQTQSVMNSFMEQFKQEAIFGEAAEATSENVGTGSDMGDENWAFDWDEETDVVEESFKDEL